MMGLFRWDALHIKVYWPAWKVSVAIVRSQWRNESRLLTLTANLFRRGTPRIVHWSDERASMIPRYIAALDRPRRMERDRRGMQHRR
jgi:hypothetical protein